jgi:hypothetical protein
MICDFFVKKEYRGSMKAIRLVQEVEKVGIEKGCSNMSCYVQVDRERPEVNTYKMKMYLKYGHKVYKADNNAIVLAKDLPKKEDQNGVQQI